ncbi:uncharacterized protein LACBIDRAFT_296468 [Laccaria bicolor S238N-H82]|uniref:Predicted protein n=1 Tax=Laccaria bicolor (strain S238N-H82 / ATCC MYA-4686) TaxID=486041 RepID=B0D8W2_LACBS|nr:uncharacterized protein LACBIDRAFT_296468 [Laccaria bicolor S238N-H82]EDR08912.1 predicted protein [Laccaria bicolor S238N-H82]|eukprot:XP_001880225.1 predicted protein [Laccaria bicolor S238N-H82]
MYLKRVVDAVQTAKLCTRQNLGSLRAGALMSLRQAAEAYVSVLLKSILLSLVKHIKKS